MITPTPTRAPETQSVAHERSLLGLSDAGADRIRRLLLRAKGLLPVALGEAPMGTALRGKTVATVFFEGSTRTRTSFSLAAQRLGATVVDLSAAASSLSKGESMTDTARNVEAMGVHAIVVRAPQAGAADTIHRAVSCSVINAGDGRHEHPTQGLLDISAIAEAFGRDDAFDLSGLHVAIVGDVVSSRVARSAVAGLTRLGARVVLVGPAHLAPKSLACLAPGLAVEHDLDMVLPEMDAVMMLRIQFERHGEGDTTVGPGAEPKKTAAIASVREYRAFYALTEERAEWVGRAGCDQLSAIRY